MAGEGTGLRLYCLDLRRWAGGPPAQQHHRASAAARRSEAGRWLLGQVLGAELGIPAGALVVGRGPHGKPGCAAAAAAGLDFNLSHAGDLVVLALSRVGEVGVDLEHPGQAPKALRIGASLFDATEREMLGSLPPAQAEARALRLWTLKEAAAKAMGETVFDALAGVVPAGNQGGWAAPRSLPPGWGDPSRWGLAAGQFDGGYLLALSVRHGNGSAGAEPVPILDIPGPEKGRVWQPSPTADAAPAPEEHEVPGLPPVNWDRLNGC